MVYFDKTEKSQDFFADFFCLNENKLSIGERTSDSVASITFFGYRHDLNFDRFSSNVVSEEFVL